MHFNIDTMDVRKLCDDFYPEFEKIRNEDHVEVEIRLGKFNGTFFDTNLGRDTHVKILKVSVNTTDGNKLYKHTKKSFTGNVITCESP